MPSWWKTCLGKPAAEPSEVVELDYRHANLIAVPPEVFAHERTLEKLSLASNQISALPPSLFHCHELRELELYDNEIQVIPAAIGSLTRLTRLDVSRNAVSEVADTIKSCKALSHLNLSLNHLVKVPEGVSQLVGLEELNLTDTCLEFLSANFGRLTKLRVLELRENLLQSLPKSMTRFGHLCRLDIGHNEMREVPEVIATMTNLTELFVDNNTILSIPKFIGNLTKLTSLDCSNNEIYEVAEELCKCTHLADLNFSFNSLSSLPSGLGLLECITILRIDNNLIQYLPEKFGHLKNLQEFSAMRNSLKALPPSFGLLRKLQTCLLDENLLTELPKEIGSCTQLSILHVTRNQLTWIPSEVGYLTNLKVLSISGNFIQHLPVSILNVPKLGAIWISDSQSKPLLPLSKETLPTGQVVLTCFLLPQVPLDPEDLVLEKETDENTVRARQPTIKFADAVEEERNGDVLEEEPVVAAGSSTVRPPGLTRAPTPYPKELRALAKHASQVHMRHSKELQNGDIPVRESRSFEGEVQLEGTSAAYSSAPRYTKSNGQGTTSNRDSEAGESERLLFHPGSRSGNTVQYDSIRRMRMGHGGAGGHESAPLTNGATVEGSGGEPWTGQSDTKTPPPYHIAARRAAFFRNSSASAGSASSASPHVTNSPLPFTVGPQSSPAFQYPPPPEPKPLATTNQLLPHPAEGGAKEPPKLQTNQGGTAAAQEQFSIGPPENAGLNETFSVVDESTNGLNTTFTVEVSASGRFESTFVKSPASSVSSHGWIPPSVSAVRLQSEIVSNGAPYSVCDEENGILESDVPGDWKHPELSSGDELEGGGTDSEGPPILPMRPIVRDYSQLSASTLGAGSNNSSALLRSPPGEGSSKIPVTARKSSEIVSGRSLNSSLGSGDRVHEPPKYVTVGGGHDYTDSGRHVTNSVTNFSGPFGNSSVQTSRSSETFGKSLGGVTRPSESSGKHHSATSIPSYRSSFGKSAPPNSENQPRIAEAQKHSGIPTLRSGLKQIHSETSLPQQSNMVRRNSSGKKVDPPRFSPTAPNGSGPVSPNNAVTPSSRIPVMNKKPWIFGTHRNTRVVPLEYRKVNELGFSICNSGTPHDMGAYIDNIDDPESSVKIGDKLLEVDGIDISKMNLEIVRKILSNCQESMNLLVSREN